MKKQLPGHYYWTGISLDCNLKKVVLVPCKSEDDATVVSESLKSISDVTIFAIDEYGTALEEDARAYYRNKKQKVILVPRDITPNGIYTILMEK